MPDLLNQSSDSMEDMRDGSTSYLSAEWVNERILNVRNRIRKLLIQRIINNGLLSSGYKPFQSPITPEILAKMTPEQAQMLINSLPTIGAKQQVIAMLQAMKLPPLRSLMVQNPTHVPSQRAFDLAERTDIPVSSS